MVCIDTITLTNILNPHHGPFMKFSQFLLFMLLSVKTISAQEKQFVYIEADNKQLFNVTINGKVYSSTSSGYVIIPKLSNGEYEAVVSFAGEALPEHHFKYVIDKKDIGFILKNFGEKGWGLFDLQTLVVIMASDPNLANVPAPVVEKPKEEYNPQISFEKKKDIVPLTPQPDEQVSTLTPAPPPVKSDTILSASNTTNFQVIPPIDVIKVVDQTSQKALPPQPGSEVAKTTEIKKVAEVKGAMGIYLTYVDYTDKASDTVQLIIPADTIAKGSSGETGSNGNRTIASSNPTKDDPRFLNMEVNRSEKEGSKEINVNDSRSPVLSNSNCTNPATESDFNKLRRRMALQTTEENKMNEARKVYKNKCFTTSQVKGLSTLFLSDEWRYKFFDVSYNFVSDVQLYSMLETELIDPYYINRFKAMIKK